MSAVRRCITSGSNRLHVAVRPFAGLLGDGLSLGKRRARSLGPFCFVGGRAHEELSSRCAEAHFIV